MEDKILIKRKDGIEYYKTIKQVVYNKNINIRVEEELIENLKQIATNKDVKYQTLIRTVLENYVEENKEV